MSTEVFSSPHSLPCGRCVLLNPSYSRILLKLTSNLWFIYTDNIEHHPFGFQLQTRTDPVPTSELAFLHFSSCLHHGRTFFSPLLLAFLLFHLVSCTYICLPSTDLSASSHPVPLIQPTFPVPTLTFTFLPFSLLCCLLMSLPPFLCFCLQPTVAWFPPTLCWPTAPEVVISSLEMLFFYQPHV